MVVLDAPREQRFLMRNISWPKYLSFADLLGESRVRLTYDRGNLELMTLSHGYEHLSSLLGQFIEVLTDELNLPRQSGGSTTLSRAAVERGLEPDRCYYLEHEAQVRGKEQIDLDIDPAPDLAIEVDVTHHSLSRMEIYAALGVSEVWRFEGGVLRVYHLTDEGRYTELERSPHFPFLPLSEVQGFLRRRSSQDETSLVRAFRTRVRELLAGKNSSGT